MLYDSTHRLQFTHTLSQDLCQSASQHHLRDTWNKRQNQLVTSNWRYVETGRHSSVPLLQRSALSDWVTMVPTHSDLLDESPLTPLRALTARTWPPTLTLSGSGSHGLSGPRHNATRFLPALVLDLPTPGGWKAEFTYRLPGNAPAWNWSRDLSITSPTP